MALAASPLALAEGTTGKSAAGDTSSANTKRADATGMSGTHSGTRGSRYGAAAMDSQTVRQVQQALADKGHNPGPIDGVMGPRTQAALKKYQQQNNLSGASGLDQQTLDSLGVQASAATGSSGRMASGSSASDSASSAGGSGAVTGGSGGRMGGSSVPNPTNSSSADQGTASDGASTSRFPTPESRASGSSGSSSSSGATARNPSPSGSNASQGTASDGAPNSSNPSGGTASRDSGSSAGGTGSTSGGAGGSGSGSR
jgi:hypothetical protein